MTNANGELADHISYHICGCGCGDLVMRTHRQDGGVISTAVFSRAEATSFICNMLQMTSGENIGKVVGNA